MSDETEKKWWEDCIEVRVNVVLPAELAGEEFPEGMVVGSKQFIDKWQWQSAKYPVDIVEVGLQQMVAAVVAKIRGEVERGTER